MTMNDEYAPSRSIMGLDFFPRQWEAVNAPIESILVVAGPGSGKTRCLTGRIASLIQRHRADPNRICAITFTNKAAQEIAKRVRHGLGIVAENLTLGTIHSLCLRILRPYAKQTGLPPGFGIADEIHQRIILRGLRVYKWRQKGLLLRFGRRRLDIGTLTPDEEELFHQYRARLIASRLIDYDDILFFTRQLLQQDESVLRDTQNRWDHVLVDEFQDLDLTQYEIIKMIAARHRSIFGVGDDEQSVFSWRGADPRVMDYFMRDFGINGAITLNINCRSSKAIFETARRILRQDGLFPQKDIRAQRESVFSVESSAHATDNDEARWLVEHLKTDLLTSKLKRGEFAVLYRTHEIGRRLEDALIGAGVPCQLSVGRAFSDDPVVAQVLSSLRLILDPDSDVELERLARLVLPESLVSQLLNSRGESLRDKIRSCAESRVGTEAKSCWRILYQVESLKSLSRTDGELSNLVDAIISLGIGAYTSPLDEVAASLPDPAGVPAARELGTKLLEITSGRVLLVPHEGLEIAARLMLRKVLPNLRVEYLLPPVIPEANDLVLTFSRPSDGAHVSGAYALSSGDQSPTMALFTALQFIESRDYRKAFSDYVVFDTETTDKDTDACQVVELAAVRVQDGIIVDQFHSLVHCTRPISTGASAVHGYHDQDLVGQPALEEIWPRFRRFIGETVLIAHNGHRFDVPVLKRLTSQWDGLKDVSFFDSLPFARHLFPTGGLRLEDLAHQFGVKTGRGHHALDDAICLANVFECLQEERLRKARVTSLGNLLDMVALGLAIEGPTPMTEVCQTIFTKGSRRALGKWSSVLAAYEADAAAHDLVCPPVAEIIDRLGGTELQEEISREKSPEDRFPEIYHRIQQLIAATNGGTLTESVRLFLDNVSLSKSDGATVDPERVCLLTFHATKGLEFSRVYVVGVEDYQLPGYYPITQNREEEIQEARRLLYVAMTRAKDRLCLTRCLARNGKPTGGTLFLSEMGLIKEEAEAGLTQ